MKLTDLLKQIAKILAIAGAVLAAINGALGEDSK
jgi:hypothetical protein